MQWTCTESRSYLHADSSIFLGCLALRMRRLIKKTTSVTLTTSSSAPTEETAMMTIQGRWPSSKTAG